MHKSRVFLYALLAFVAGVALRSFVVMPSAVLYLFGIIGGFLLIYWLSAKEKQIYGIAGLFCIAFAVGTLRYQQKDANLELATLRAFNGSAGVVIEGVVIEEPNIREKNTRYVIIARSVAVLSATYPVSGKVIIFANRYPVYQFGDLVSFTGDVSTPEAFDNFDYPAFLAKDEIYSQMFYPETQFLASGEAGRLRAVLFDIKQTFEHTARRALPEPHAAFLSGLVVGARSSIPIDILEAFRVTGVSHIIALSGFNITIIAESVRRALRMLAASPAVAFWIATIFIFLFTLMVGASPSIVRAAILGVLVLLARKEGRMYNVANALVFAGALMIFQNPKILRFDVAFQLSFLATVGLLYAAPRIEKYFIKLPRVGGFRDTFVTTFSAQLMVVPLLLFHFGTVSLVSPVTNVLILSVIPMTMFFGFVMWIFGFVSTTMSMLPAGFAYSLLGYQLFVVDIFSRIPYADIYIGEISWILAAMFYIGILYWLLKQ